MKAETKVRVPKKLRRMPFPELGSSSPEEVLEEKRAVNMLGRKMADDFKTMAKEERDTLLTELHRLSEFKRLLDWYVESQRNDASRFGKYRQWLADVDTRLSKIVNLMEKSEATVNDYPMHGDPKELDRLIINKVVGAFVKAGTELLRAIAVVRDTQYVLAAGINPQRRSAAEKKLVPREPRGLRHTKLPLREKTRQIDMWFVREAASILEKHRTRTGKPIPNLNTRIEHFFEFALSEKGRTAESIRRELSPSRRKKPRQLF